MSQTLDNFTRAYIECALWSSTDDAEEPLDRNHDILSISPEALARIESDCAKFQSSAWDLIASDVTRAGHDFWLTRNHHGAGFWDGDWADGSKLTELAHSFGECNLYVGDDGNLYIYGQKVTARE